MPSLFEKRRQKNSFCIDQRGGKKGIELEDLEVRQREFSCCQKRFCVSPPSPCQLVGDGGGGKISLTSNLLRGKGGICSSHCLEGGEERFWVTFWKEGGARHFRQLLLCELLRKRGIQFHCRKGGEVRMAHSLLPPYFHARN